MLFMSSLHAKLINTKKSHTKGLKMRNNYDFSNSVPNPYVKQTKKQITIRLDQDVIGYFKKLSEKKRYPLSKSH